MKTRALNFGGLKLKFPIVSVAPNRLPLFSEKHTLPPIIPGTLLQRSRNRLPSGKGQWKALGVEGE
jgi:hypothetical protein